MLKKISLKEENPEMVKERSVDKDVEGFCGWPFLQKLVEAAPSHFMQALISAQVETGGRISEVLALRKWNIDLSLHKEVAVVKHMLLLKRFAKVAEVKKWKCKGHCHKRWISKPAASEFRIHKIVEYVGWITKPLREFRTFPFRLDEPLAAYFISWWKKVKRDKDLLFPIKRSAAFVRVRDVGKELNKPIPLANIDSNQIYDHFFRAERACQLAFDYGFDKDDLDEFFGWKKRQLRMSDKYASLGWIGLARKMGVKV